MRDVVVDASVALKWQLEDEADTAAALSLRDDIVLRARLRPYAPSIFVYEVVNGIGVAVKRRRMEVSQGREALNNLFSIDIALRTPSVNRMFAVAAEYDLSAYDSSYVVIAEELQVELWTADRRLYEATRGSLHWVRWIGDYAT